MKAINNNLGVILFTLICLFLVMPLTYANNSPKPSVNLQNEIYQKIQSPDFSTYGIENEETLLTFHFNQKGQIVIKEVVSETEYLKQFIKAKLNYKKINTEGVQLLTSYKMKITFKIT